MAVTKTHPIKSTLKAAIDYICNPDKDYICNPDKTDGKLLGDPPSAAPQRPPTSNCLDPPPCHRQGHEPWPAPHPAFEPGEVTPEEAHRIGMELAREVLGGKYEFVLTTHIDRDHVHNHLIFNAVSFQDHRHYHSNKRSYAPDMAVESSDGVTLLPASLKQEITDVDGVDKAYADVLYRYFCKHKTEFKYSNNHVL